MTTSSDSPTSSASPSSTSAAADGDIVARPNRSIVLVGMMGVGKSAVGKRLAHALGMEFVDADQEIEAAAGYTVPEIFERFGEAYFRDGERRVIARLLRDKPACVLAAGGGAFQDPETRQRVAERAVSVWLKADIDMLARRMACHGDRPMLDGADGDIAARLADLAKVRDPIYALADLHIETGDGAPDDCMRAVIAALRERGLLTVFAKRA